MTSTKNPNYDFAYNQGVLDVCSQWSDLEDQWHDEAEELGFTNQWQIDSYIQDKTVKWFDVLASEAALQRTIAMNKLEAL